MLETGNSKIIGFTTGEGSYGELNVTISARKDLLVDIKEMLRKRITEKFKNWDENRLQQASKYCVDELSNKMDGSRILKALNPYDYEIHSFLSYILTLQMLGMTTADDAYIIRSMVSLDSYRHWFAEDGTLSKDNMRPDFMLLEIPNTEENREPERKLKINIKMIECKMGFANENHLAKAKEQLKKGIEVMGANWNPQNTGVMHRYWLNQLYRAIIFSPLNMENTAKDYITIRDKIYNILNGHFEIEWTGDIFAFWLDVNDDHHGVEDILPQLAAELQPRGIILSSTRCHTCGQLFIQKMLLPPENREEVFAYNEPVYEQPVYDGDAEEDEPAFNIADAIDGRLDAAPNDSTQAERSRALASQTFFDEPLFSPLHIPDENANDSSEEMPSPESTITSTAQAASGNEDSVPFSDGDHTVGSGETGLHSVRLRIGEDLRTKETYYWEFGNKELNNRHLLINGNSGCGKTYCIQALLMEAAQQGVSSVVFDYTGGFTSSKLAPLFKDMLGERIQQRIIRISKIPVNPFVKHEIQIDEDLFVPENDVDIATKIAEIFATVYSLGDQQKSAVYSAVLAGMKTYGESMSFPLMVEELENIGTNYAKTVISKIQAFTDINPFTTEETFDWSDIRDSEGIVYVIQLTGYGRDIQILLTELLLWDIWSYCVKNGDESKPFILVLDEAQNLSHGDKSPSAKILTEGRKFGLSGWYATQFMKPQLSDDEIQRLQQAGQKLYFCPPDEGVVTVAKNIDISTQGAKEWSERLKKLKKGECVTCGNMVRNGKWQKYDPKVVKVTSLQERLHHD